MDKKTLYTRFVSFALAAGMLAGGIALPSGAGAAPGTSLESLQQQARTAQTKLDSMNTQMESASEDYYAAKDKTDKTKKEIKASNEQLKAAQAELTRSQDQLSDRATAEYRTGSSSLLTIIFGSTSFQDFVTRMDYMSRISQNDANLVKEVRSARNKIEHTQYVLKQQKATEERQEAAELKKLKDVQGLLAAQQNYLDGLNDKVRNEMAAQEAAREERDRREAAAKAAASQSQHTSSSGSSGGSSSSQSSGGSSGGSSHSSGGNGGSSQSSGDSSSNNSNSGGYPRPFNPGSLGSSHPSAVTKARKYIGVPYLWGGTSPAGFDCSGLVMYVYNSIGISLPRTSRSQFTVGAYIPPNRRDLLEPGDLMFFATNVNDPNTIHHVTIYSGSGMMVEAPHTGANVREVTSYRSGYIGAVRP